MASDASAASDPRRVFSVIGTLPEPGGYAVAKFSRSARPYQEWIQELTQEGASKFYEQFYFAYGHASIADLAHVTMVAENISIVAAIEVLDEQLVDAQESSTRYQDFRRRRYYTPRELTDSPLAHAYRDVCDRLFATYQQVHRALVPHYEQAYQSVRPADLPDEDYKRTVRARAFDVARYLLPSSTYTGLGYLCSARTLERQISRLAGSPLAEIREMAEALRLAAIEPAFNPIANRLAPALDSYGDQHPDRQTAELLEQVRQATLTDAAAAPSLVRYTSASPYPDATLKAVAGAAARILGDIQPDGRRAVSLASPLDPTTEVAATLLYRAGQHSYEQIVERLASQPREDVEALASVAFAERGPHDDLVREARAGYSLVFDMCLDNGAFRDLHRHRNCVQIIPAFTAQYGYDTPDDVAAIGEEEAYRAAMDEAGELAARLEEQHTGLGQYALPLGYRRRALFKMDSAQVTYMVEQRTAPAGHFSYRDIAYQMYTAFRERFPVLAKGVRVTKPDNDRFFDR
jgi:thymidylate synthase ThyX